MSRRDLRSWAWFVASVAVSGVVVAVGCGDDAGSDATSSGAAAQGGGATTAAGTGSPAASGAGGATGTTSTASSSGPTTVTQGPGPVAVSASSGGGSAPFECDPPAAPGSLYERSAVDYSTFQLASMCEYRGEVALIVNIAAL